jgi:hypothetical protein
MNNSSWVKEFPAAIKACDANGILIMMNDIAEKNAETKGGRGLIGKSIIPLHSDPSKEKINMMLKKHSINCYTIEKNGVKVLIYQSPWYEKNEFKGIVELSLEIPWDMPHYVREVKK